MAAEGVAERAICPYEVPIRRALAAMERSEVNPAYVEAYMRVAHSTLDGLSPEEFLSAADLAVQCIDASSESSNLAIARSYGLLVPGHELIHANATEIFTPLSESDHHKLQLLTRHYSYFDMVTALAIEARVDGAVRLANQLFALTSEWKRRAWGQGADIDYTPETILSAPDYPECTQCGEPIVDPNDVMVLVAENSRGSIALHKAGCFQKFSALNKLGEVLVGAGASNG